jgi:hypothetical protein
MTDEPLRKSYDRLMAIRAAGDTGRADCLPPEDLQQLLDRSGPEQERLRLLDHVMACPYCQPEFELLRMVRDAAPGPA